MGLFSRTPAEPEPVITRTLTTLQNVYHPGSAVAGTLTLQCPTQRRIARIEAAFHGTCTTHAWRKDSTAANSRTDDTVHYHDEAPLFRTTQVLEKSIFARPGQMFSWPFTFIFPSETTNLRGEVYRKDTACSPLYQVLPHGLPPTFAFELTHSTYARVEYHVEAVVYFEESQKPLTVKFEQLHFSPFPPVHQPKMPYSEQAQHVGKFASSRLTGEGKSFRRSFQDKFSSSTPSLDVGLKFSVLPVAAVGAPFSMFVCAELTNLSDPYAIHVPEVRLRIKSLKLSKTTVHRAMRADGWSVWPEMEETHAESVPLNALPDTKAAAPQIGDDKQLRCFADFQARIPSDTCPAFSTLSINHSCSLKAVVEIEICGKTFEKKFEIQPLQILPAEG